MTYHEPIVMWPIVYLWQSAQMELHARAPMLRCDYICALCRRYIIGHILP